ncbi:hemerythrin domain-containing protein [Candidatus Pacearchaeota archaeon]|nr:hemerythrin domain-containing protein [Candidatus Pacearchaeota archaeon]
MSKNMKTILSFMGEDHDRLDNIFKDFKNENIDKNKAKNLFQEFKTELQRHIAWEEEILFLLFENKTGMSNAGPTAVMRTEHKQIKELLEKIRVNLANDNIHARDLENGLIEILTEHNNKEESILYPWIDSSVSEKEKEKAFAEMKKLSSIM